MAPTKQQQQIIAASLNEETEHIADIFAESKILVAIHPSATPGRLEIKHACGGFRQSFGYDDTSSIPFSALIGAATSMETLSKIEDCIKFNRRAINVYMNLYTSNGNPLSCHLSLLTICGDPQKPVPPVPFPSSESNMDGGLDSFNLDGTFGAVKAVIPPEKMAMISIRSAAVVGHAKISGMGYVHLCQLYLSFSTMHTHTQLDI